MLLFGIIALLYFLAIIYRLAENFRTSKSWSLENYSQTMRKIPVIGAPFWFEWDVHKQALKNSSIAWFLVTSPIFMLVLFASPSGTSPSPVFTGVFAKFLSVIKSDGLYVYCASFLTPYLAIGIGRLIEAFHRKMSSSSDEDEGFNSIQLRGIFGGYWWGFAVACVLLLLTALAYAGQILNPSSYTQTNLNQLLKDVPFLIYCMSLYLWYLSFLDHCNTSSNYTEEFRASEEKAASRFSARVNEINKEK